MGNAGQQGVCACESPMLGTREWSPRRSWGGVAWAAGGQAVAGPRDGAAGPCPAVLNAGVVQQAADEQGVVPSSQASCARLACCWQRALR